jgi:uncharacterized double-CXXCG motif protein
MRFYLVRDATSPRYSWDLHTEQRWFLPGLRCPRCAHVFAVLGESYPTTDLSQLPERKKFTARVAEDLEEFTRLREMVRPLVPAGSPLAPGTRFGPLSGTARGNFPEMVLPNPWSLLMRKEALGQLQEAGLHGLTGCPMDLRFRQQNAPELLELLVDPRGKLHPDCLPPGKSAPCATCGRYDFNWPAWPILDAATLPADRDLFRLSNFQTAIVGTERFVETAQWLGFGEVEFHELPTR